uniref:Uncharacterized protein n=1 Tax=Physcomitrium patens TaxID=3218 RepID=A0A2K1L1L9_PHYPA|nr:hypothetical protein PHYPA_002719 [Physcomitrium patens]
MYSDSMIPPYATMVDPPVYEKRADALLPPWLKDEPEIVTGRSHDPDAFMPCNSQTAPFATFHNLPSPLEYDGPLTEAPWNKETPVNPTYRGPYPNEYRHSSPFAITDNYKQPPQVCVQELYQGSGIYLTCPCGRDKHKYCSQRERMYSNFEIETMRLGTKNCLIRYQSGVVESMSIPICHPHRLPRLRRLKTSSIKSRQVLNPPIHSLMMMIDLGKPYLHAENLHSKEPTR